MEQSVSLTEMGMKSIKEFGSSNAVITTSNEQMTTQIMEMDHYQAIEHVSAATQENSAGVETIEDMVVRIRELAGKDNS